MCVPFSVFCVLFVRKCVLFHYHRVSTQLRLNIGWFQPLQATKAFRESSGIAYSVLDVGTRRGEGSASRPGRFLPPGKTRYPLYRRLGGPQGRSGQVRKISPPQGFDPQTVQPVASRYTD
jgi:hypothetical protein